MKALVLKEYGNIVYTDVPDPAPCGADDVTVAIRACGICGSDVAGMAGRTGRRIPPVIMGHESTGVIHAVGSAVTGFVPGDRVAISASQFCGVCDMCRNGRTNMCVLHRVLGISCADYKLDGAYAQFTRVPARTVFHLPEGVSFVEGALLEPLANAVHGVTAAGRTFDAPVLVYGCGTIGLMAIQALRAYRCPRIIAVDTNADKRALALRCGAHVALGAEGENVVARVMEETNGAGVTLCVECVGVEATLRTALSCLSNGGMASVVGLLEQQITVPMQRVVTGEITIRGSFTYTADDFRESIRLIRSREVDPSLCVSDIVPLSRGAEAFERLRLGKENLVKLVLSV